MEKSIDPIATILIIENDEDLLDKEVYYLEKEGYEVIGVTSTQRVEEILKNGEGIDLILMARMLPSVEGSEYIIYLREKGYTTPVMYVSSKTEDYHIEEGYDRGGDDYLRKPFNMNELLYRVKALLKRTKHTEFDKMSARDIVMDFNTRNVYVDEEEVSLTKLEFDLLAFFIENTNKVLKRENILRNIWKDQVNIQKRTVNVTIKRLKEKIDPDNVKEYIIPVRGIGYRFNAL
jgi:DNA-binding response OmpR family regulator